MNDKNDATPSDESTAPEADETFAWAGDAEGEAGPDDGKGREWVAQLQAMIENITEQAGPALRQVSAKAAELAAVAGEKAGPMAARAAELTAEAGSRLAERSRDLATELRREQAAKASEAETATADAAASEDEPAS